MDSKCERCGYIAPNIKNLVKHVKEEKMCPAILSNISHINLLNKLQPPPDLTCKFCKLLCKSKGAHTTHVKYHCHLNPERVEIKKKSQETSSNKIVCEEPVKQNEVIKKYIHKDTSNTKGLTPFNKDIDWNKVNLSQKEILKCIVNINQGLLDLFIIVHSKEEHKNIEWVNDKLLVYDGKGWTEINDELLSTHLGYLYSYMEECWCDYLMDVRCGNIESSLDQELIDSIDNFFYEQIVDEESVLFHCRDVMFEYLETLKTC